MFGPWIGVATLLFGTTSVTSLPIDPLDRQLVVDSSRYTSPCAVVLGKGLCGPLGDEQYNVSHITPCGYPCPFEVHSLHPTIGKFHYSFTPTTVDQRHLSPLPDNQVRRITQNQARRIAQGQELFKAHMKASAQHKAAGKAYSDAGDRDCALQHWNARNSHLRARLDIKGPHVFQLAMAHQSAEDTATARSWLAMGNHDKAKELSNKAFTSSDWAVELKKSRAPRVAIKKLRKGSMACRTTCHDEPEVHVEPEIE